MKKYNKTLFLTAFSCIFFTSNACFAYLEKCFLDSNTANVETKKTVVSKTNSQPPAPAQPPAVVVNKQPKSKEPSEPKKKESKSSRMNGDVPIEVLLEERRKKYGF